jgi:hypothetical protein
VSGAVAAASFATNATNATNAQFATNGDQPSITSLSSGSVTMTGYAQVNGNFAVYGSWARVPVFNFIQGTAGIPEGAMYYYNPGNNNRGLLVFASGQWRYAN